MLVAFFGHEYKFAHVIWFNGKQHVIKTIITIVIYKKNIVNISIVNNKYRSPPPVISHVCIVHC